MPDTSIKYVLVYLKDCLRNNKRTGTANSLANEILLQTDLLDETRKFIELYLAITAPCADSAVLKCGELIVGLVHTAELPEKIGGKTWYRQQYNGVIITSDNQIWLFEDLQTGAGQNIDYERAACDAVGFGSYWDDEGEHFPSEELAAQIDEEAEQDDADYVVTLL